MAYSPIIAFLLLVFVAMCGSTGYWWLRVVKYPTKENSKLAAFSTGWTFLMAMLLSLLALLSILASE